MGHQIVIPVIRRGDYEVAFEQFDDFTFVHVRVHKWSHSVARKMLAEWLVLLDLHGGPIHALNLRGPTQLKFLRLFGFSPCGECKDIDGNPCILYRKD
jgi:hypothetical protein